jgi:curved DNA-binding protein CbpA
MAPPVITADYYSTLGVVQTATLELITRAYRRLALKLHPDRGGSTQAFQLLGLAYETLKDENKRRAYDQIYSSIRRNQTNVQSSQGTQIPRAPPAPASQSETNNDADRLAAYRKESEVRGAQWRAKHESLMSPIIALQQSIRVLEQEIKDLGDAAVAAAAVEARNKRPTAFDLLAALSTEDDEDERAREDRQRQEKRQRRTEIESKEWRIGLLEVELQKKKKLMNQAKDAVNATSRIIEREIQVIEARVQERKTREQRRREGERREKERLQKLMRQAKEAQEAARRRQAEVERSRQAMRDQRAEAQIVRNDAQRTRDDAQRAEDTAQRTRDDARRVKVAAQSAKDDVQRAERKAREVLAAGVARQEEQERLQSACGHGGWWDKLPGPATCPECEGVWSFLLKCPGCTLQVCPRCQLSLRPKSRRKMAKADRSSG